MLLLRLLVRWDCMYLYLHIPIWNQCGCWLLSSKLSYSFILGKLIEKLMTLKCLLWKATGLKHLYVCYWSKFCRFTVLILTNRHYFIQSEEVLNISLYWMLSVVLLIVTSTWCLHNFDCRYVNTEPPFFFHCSNWIIFASDNRPFVRIHWFVRLKTPFFLFLVLERCNI